MAVWLCRGWRVVDGWVVRGSWCVAWRHLQRIAQASALELKLERVNKRIAQASALQLKLERVNKESPQLVWCGDTRPVLRRTDAYMLDIVHHLRFYLKEAFLQRGRR